jgi:hypothetical protein
MGRPDRKKQVVRHGRRWKDNIKMDLRDIALDNMD